MSPDYMALLRRRRDPLQLRAGERIIRFPFVLAAADERTDEGIARVAEERHEQGKMLQEMAAKRRIEKVFAAKYTLLFSRYEGVDVLNSWFRGKAIFNT